MSRCLPACSFPVLIFCTYDTYVCTASCCAIIPKYIAKHGMAKMRFHDLRHSCASLLLANGVPLKHIQEWLGHSDFTTTANIYAHLDYKSKITSAQAMETGLALPEGGDFSSRWSSISAGENS